MAKIYVQEREVWVVTELKLVKYDTEDLRKAFPVMAEWDDEQIINHIKENRGGIDLMNFGDDTVIEIGEVLQGGSVETASCSNDPIETELTVFVDPADCDQASLRAWCNGDNNLRCKDWSVSAKDAFKHFAETMPICRFEGTV